MSGVAVALSPTMHECLAYTERHGGALLRFPGGFWQCWTNDKTYFGTSTVEALVSRGHMEYAEWQEGRRGRFPIRAAVTAAGRLALAAGREGPQEARHG